ncbi:MAG: NADH-quinone oxidoreductase subunit J [Bacteroidetes bacterium]|nr:NADH-quinone oxidoreductase subunit J [Bacteroidota bacterium]
MTSNQFMFLLFSAVIVIFSILTVTSRRILRAATFLLFVLVATAGLYFLLKYNYLAAIQLALYAGGIVVLIIFSILLTSHINERLPTSGLMKKLPAALIAILGAALCISVILQYNFIGAVGTTEPTNVKLIGESLINYGKYGYALPFEVISVLLLAAMIGAIILAKKRKD